MAWSKQARAAAAAVRRRKHKPVKGGVPIGKRKHVKIKARQAAAFSKNSKVVRSKRRNRHRVIHSLERNIKSIKQGGR